MSDIQLPPPDDWISGEDDNGKDCQIPTWQAPDGEYFTAFVDGVETEDHGLVENLAFLRDKALRMLAAVEECERLRLEFR